MPLTIVDTDILIDEGRGITHAAHFLDEVESGSILAISIITQMELMVGCRNKAEQGDLATILQRFQVLTITADIAERAVGLLQRYNLSHGLLIPDALIAATAVTLDQPFATKNRRDFHFIEGLDLVPYPA